MSWTSCGRMLVAELAAFPAAALSSAWLVGDVSYGGDVDGELDYAFHPLGIPQVAFTLMGVAGLVSLVTTVVLIHPVRGARAPLACVVLAGAGLGTGYRIVTAGVVGANIGAGLVFFVLAPVSIGLLAAAVILTIRCLRSVRRRESRPAFR